MKWVRKFFFPPPRTICTIYSIERKYTMYLKHNKMENIWVKKSWDSIVKCLGLSSRAVEDGKFCVDFGLYWFRPRVLIRPNWTPLQRSVVMSRRTWKIITVCDFPEPVEVGPTYKSLRRLRIHIFPVVTHDGLLVCSRLPLPVCLAFCLSSVCVANFWCRRVLVDGTPIHTVWTVDVPRSEVVPCCILQVQLVFSDPFLFDVYVPLSFIIPP